MSKPHLTLVVVKNNPYRWTCSASFRGSLVVGYGYSPEDAWWDYVDVIRSME